MFPVLQCFAIQRFGESTEATSEACLIRHHKQETSHCGTCTRWCYQHSILRNDSAWQPLNNDKAECWDVACRVVSSTGALELEEVPDEMVVVGGGVIGLELGSVWSRLGSKVTVIEFTDNIVPGMDSDLRRAFQRTLQKQGALVPARHSCW